ncbi:unnamed protein product [Ambrosiozyma monospora]|uniref:Unnamed protein product n=1 Tax=Ambrosiozyma monospora TaxID=43982 RepID=A0A9W7DKA5_AMBMO|nr:unnamed protein product [Ambrosiozyma monospora]
MSEVTENSNPATTEDVIIDIDNDETSETDEINKLKQKEQELQQMKMEIQQKLKAFDKETFMENLSLVQQYSNLPSLDFEKRLTTIKMFYPNMIISEINQTIDESSTMKSMNGNNILNFTIRFKPFMRFSVTICIDSTKAVEKLKIEPVGISVVVEATEIVSCSRSG